MRHSLSIWMVQRRQAQSTMTWLAAAGVVSESKPASVSYTYAINGAPFWSSRIRVAGGGNYKQLLNRYKAGSAVQVFYDPNNPASAVLERAAPAPWIWPVVGAVAVVLRVGVMAR
jgi:hypothetical protein